MGEAASDFSQDFVKSGGLFEADAVPNAINEDLTNYEAWVNISGSYQPCLPTAGGGDKCNGVETENISNTLASECVKVQQQAASFVNGGGHSMTACLGESVFPDGPESQQKTGSAEGKEDTLPCPQCNLIFTTDALSLLESHMCTSHSDEFCDQKRKLSGICSHDMVGEKLALNLKSCDDDITNNSNKPQRDGALCVLHIKPDQKEHNDDNNNNTNNKCADCGKVFRRNIELRNHLFRSHDGDRPHKCTECGETFSVKSNLSRHFRIHSAEKSFQCYVCGILFSDSSTFQAHLRNHRRAGKRRNKYEECPICGRSNGHMKRHLRTHTGEKPYQCTICDKVFANTNTRTEHMRIHSGEKPYQCIACSKAFTYSSNFRKHMRLHTGEKPYTCDVCGKDFSDRNNYQCHVRVHSGEKPYVCPVCEKGFHQSSHRKWHMRTQHGIQ